MTKQKHSAKKSSGPDFLLIDNSTVLLPFKLTPNHMAVRENCRLREPGSLREGHQCCKGTSTEVVL